MKEELLTITDGLNSELLMTCCEVGDGPKDAVVIAAATAVPKEYYKYVAVFLAENGFAVYTFNYSGSIRTRQKDLKNAKESMVHWGSRDLESVLSFVLKKHPITNLLGHSVAGQIMCFAPSISQVNAIYLVASQSAYHRLWTGSSGIVIRLFWFLLVPLSTWIWGYMPGFVMGSPNGLNPRAAQSWRQFALNEKGSFGLSEEATQRAAEISCPIIFRALENDPILAPIKAVKALACFFQRSNYQVIYDLSGPWQGMGHFDVFRKDKGALWQEISEYFKNA
jgi:predicted alpha/beta hydrolase